MNAEQIAEIAQARPYRDGWRGPCPVHGGRSGKALSVREGERGVLIRCWGGCSTEEILRALHLRWGDLFRDGSGAPRSRTQREQRQREKARAEMAALSVWDATLSVRRYFGGGLRRAERLQARIGRRIVRARTEADRERCWEKLRRLAPCATFYLAGFVLASSNDSALTARFALASPAERRKLIFEGIRNATDAAAA